MKRTILVIIWLAVVSVSALFAFPELRDILMPPSRGGADPCVGQLVGKYHNESLKVGQFSSLHIRYFCDAGEIVYQIKLFSFCEENECPSKWFTIEEDNITGKLTARLFQSSDQPQTITVQSLAENRLSVQYTTSEGQEVTEHFVRYTHLSDTNTHVRLVVTKIFGFALENCPPHQPQYVPILELAEQEPDPFTIIRGREIVSKWEVKASVPAGTRFVYASVQVTDVDQENCASSNKVDLTEIPEQSTLHLKIDLVTDDVYIINEITGETFSTIGSTNQPDLKSEGNEGQPRAEVTFQVEVNHDW